MSTNNPYFQLFDLIEREVSNDDELIEEFVELASKSLVRKGADRIDALEKVKHNLRQLSEVVTTKVARKVNDEDEQPVRRVGHLMKATEVASVLNVTRQQVYNLMNDGALPFTNAGGTKKVNSVDLDKYLNN